MVSKINKYAKTTTKHTHTVTITITKQCGGTPVSFDSVSFNLEHKRVSAVNIQRSGIFQYYHSVMI